MTNAGVPQDAACMAVLVQRQLAPDLSFVLHTRHPGEPFAASSGFCLGLHAPCCTLGTRVSPCCKQSSAGMLRTVFGLHAFLCAAHPPHG